MKFIGKFLIEVFALFFLLSFIFIPLTFNGKDFQYQTILFLFHKPVELIQYNLFPSAIRNIDFSSDTIGLNLLLLLLVFLSIITIIGLRIFKVRTASVINLFYIISPYYIGAILLKYGIDKILLVQFSTPEANILYTPLGNLTKDILLWSTLGTSKFYNIAVGFLEVLAATLLFFRKSRIIGFYIVFGILLNICLINFAFDISVKTFSIFLFLVTIANLLPSIKQVYLFFTMQRAIQLKLNHNTLQFPYHNTVKFVSLLVIYVYLLCPIYPGFKNENRLPTFNKAYEVISFTSNNKIEENERYKRIFFHKNDYIIFQKNNDDMLDYHYKLDKNSKVLVLQDYNDKKFNINYSFDNNGNLILEFKNNDIHKFVLKSINWSALPALSDDIHYTIDEIQ